MKKIILLMLICLIPIVFAAKIINVKAPDPAYQNQENTFTEDNYFEDIYVRNIEVELNATILNYTVVNQTLAQDITASGIIEAGDAGTGCQMNGVPSTLFCYDGMKIYTILDSLNYWATAEGSYLSRDNLLNIEGDINSSSKITAGDTVFAPIVQGGDAGKGGQFGGVAGAAFIYNGMEMMSFETGDYHFVTDGNSYLDDDENLNIDGWVNTSDVNLDDDISFFDGADVDNAAQGKNLVIHRNAAEFDAIAEIYLDSYGRLTFDGTGSPYAAIMSIDNFYSNGKLLFPSYGGYGIFAQATGNDFLQMYTGGLASSRNDMIVMTDTSSSPASFSNHVGNIKLVITGDTSRGTNTLILEHNNTRGIIQTDSGNITMIPDSGVLEVYNNITARDLIHSQDMIADDDITAAGTVQAEHLYSTDDVVVDDSLILDVKVDSTWTGESNCCCEMFEDNCQESNGHVCVVQTDENDICVGVYGSTADDWFIMDYNLPTNCPLCMGEI